MRAIGEELRETRLQASLTQRELGAVVGISGSEISRIERGESPHVAFEKLSRLGAALGLDIVLRAYPNGDAVRDAAQLALLARFRAALPAGLRHRAEVPLGIPGDRRAWDEVVDARGWWLPVEAESRLRDVQALLRRLALKCRDAGVDCVLLLVADTRHNRHVLRMYEAEFAAAFSVPGKVALAALRAGVRPEGSTVVML
jgi:transcriptional regulator with XRE-family HTH domain